MVSARPSTAFDPTADHPAGRVPHPDHHRRAALRVRDSGWSLRGAGILPARGRLEHLHGSLDKLDDFHDVVVESGVTSDEAVELVSKWAVRAAARGTFVIGDPQTIPIAHSPTLNSVPGDLEWDLASVRQRREALQLVDPRPLPPVSVLLVTRRPNFVPAILRMMENQTHPDFEVVVVNHSDDPLEVNTTLPHKVLHASTDDSFGNALNLASAAATKPLLTKIDDDDHYGPDHLVDLVLAHRYSGATLVGKGGNVVHIGDLNTTVRRVFGCPEEFTDRVAGGTILMSADDLASVGGWPDVPRAVDTHLLRQVADHGGLVYRAHDIGYLYVRHKSAAGVQHTWDTDHRHFLRNTREQWFGLLQSADFGTAQA